MDGNEREVVEDELSLPRLQIGQVDLRLHRRGEGSTPGALIVPELGDSDGSVFGSQDHAVGQPHHRLRVVHPFELHRIDGHLGGAAANQEDGRDEHPGRGNDLPVHPSSHALRLSARSPLAGPVQRSWNMAPVLRRINPFVPARTQPTRISCIPSVSRRSATTWCAPAPRSAAWS